MMSIKILLIFISSMFATVLLSQSTDTLDTGFLQHLEKNKLYRDKLFYLQRLDAGGIDSSSLQLESAWTYFKLGEHTRANHLFSGLGKTTLLQSGYYSLWLRSASDLYSEHYFKTLLKDTLGLGKYKALLEMFALKHPKEMSLLGFEPQVVKSYEQYYKINSKRMTSAILLSTLVPGLGKYYIGKRNDGISSFITVSVLGLQFAEAWWKKGIYDWRSVLFGGLTLSFHTANIYGTYKALVKSKVDKKKEFLKALDENYYNNIQHYSVVH